MGWDTDLFLVEPSEQLMCSICHGVLEDPMHLAACDHTFCKTCIEDWLKTGSTCPIDREEVSKTGGNNPLKPVTRLVRGMLEEMQLRCPYTELGCRHTCQMAALQVHLKVCDFNPANFKTCDEGCGLRLRLPAEDHNCVQELLQIIDMLRDEVQSYKKSSATLETELQQIKQQLNQNNSQNSVSAPKQESSSDQIQVQSEARSAQTQDSGLAFVTSTPIVETIVAHNEEPAPQAAAQMEGAIGGLDLLNLQAYDRSATPKIIVTGGSNSQDGILATVELFDLNLECWADMPPMPTPRVGHQIVVHKKCIYVLGGKSSADGEPLSSIDKYDAGSQSWISEALPPMMEPRAYFAAILLLNHIYVVGREGLNSGEKIDLSNPQAGWQPIKQVPIGPYETVSALPAECQSQDAGFYLFGVSKCSSSKSFFETAYYYSVTADRWDQLGSNPSVESAAVNDSALVSSNGYIYGLGGGMINCLDPTSFLVDKSSKSSSELEWFPLGELPSGQTGGCRAVTCEEKIYLLGGYMSAGDEDDDGDLFAQPQNRNELSSVVSFQPATGVWTPCDPMSRPRVSPACAVLYL